MKASLQEISCPLCGARNAKRLGRRGNREHHGADPKAEPHVWTYVTRCRSCDLIYANPMIRGMEQLEREYYGDPETYQATAEGDPAAMFRNRLDLIERHCAKGTLLDVGAGKGEFLAEANRRGWKVKGVEPSEAFCRHAAKIHGLEIVPGFLGQARGILEDSFDVVTLNHVLEHVETPLELLRLCARYVKPGGVLFVEVPNTDSHLLRAADVFFRLKGLDWSSRLSPIHPPFHSCGYTAASMRYALERSGWRIETVLNYSGRDRGYRKAARASAAAVMRDMASAVLDRLGNRELLAAVARRPS